jgi:fucose 4-O-acetylase-like acetyltransferase
MSKRLVHIDIARGFGILSVVIAHNAIVYDTEWLYKLLAAFLLPLFFFLSGIFFKPTESFKVLLVKRADAFLKPFFVIQILLGLLHIVVQGYNPLQTLLGIFYATGETIEWVPLWFLPHLFVVYVVGWAIINFTKLDKTHLVVRILVLLSLLLIGYFLIDMFWQVPLVIGGEPIVLFGQPVILPGLPFTIDGAPFSVFFFLVGFLTRERVKNIKNSPVLFVISLVIFLVLYFFTECVIDLDDRYYRHIVFATLAGLLGTYIVLAISKFLSKQSIVSSVLAYIGANSLIILIFHYAPQNNAYKLLNSFFPNAYVLNTTVAFLIGVIAPLVINLIIQKTPILRMFFLPIKFRKRTQIQKEPVTPA